MTKDTRSNQDRKAKPRADRTPDAQERPSADGAVELQEDALEGITGGRLKGNVEYSWKVEAGEK